VTTLADYRHLASGKVRDLYEVDDELLLMVASDRISAYDHVLPNPIPDKGRVLTAMSVFWFDLLADLVPGHVEAVDDARIPLDNNATERAIRGPVVGRRNHFGSKSRRGTEVAATLYTVVETAKLHDIDPAAYIHAAIVAADRNELLLPAQFAAQTTK